MKALAAIVLLLGLTSSAGAEVDLFSANYKLQSCRDFAAMGEGNMRLNRELVQDPSRLFNVALCGGEMLGIAHALQITGQICSPDGVTSGQIDAVVMTHNERIPERQHESFAALAVEALKRAWPCRH